MPKALFIFCQQEMILDKNHVLGYEKQHRKPGHMDKVTDIAEQSSAPEAPAPRPRWVRGALIKGFYASAQSYEAAKLSAARMMPQKIAPYFNRLTGGPDALAGKIARWERRIKEVDVKPAHPGRFKSAVSVLLFNAAYILPPTALGLAADFAGGEMAGFVTPYIFNLHSALGEAFVQTARSRRPGFSDPAILRAALDDPDFNKSVRRNILLKGGITFAVTVASGPFARYLTRYTGAVTGVLMRTPLGRKVTERALRGLQTNVIKSIYKGLGGLFANAAIGNGKGPAKTLVNAASSVSSVGSSLLFIRGAVKVIFDRASSLWKEPDCTAKKPEAEKTREKQNPAANPPPSDPACH